MMIDTSPWSSCSDRSLCSSLTFSSTGPSVSPFWDFFFYFSSQFCTALSAKWRKVNFSNFFCNEVLKGCPKLKSRFINSKIRSVPILVSKEKTCKQHSIKINCFFQRPTEPQWPTSASKSWRRWKTKPSFSICILFLICVCIKPSISICILIFICISTKPSFSICILINILYFY